MHPDSLRPGARRAVALIAFVVALLVIGTIVLWVLQVTATGSASYLAHFSSMGAFYAAESGLEMGLREATRGIDIDSDGTIGTISNNGNESDDPAVASGSFNVSVSVKTYTATG